MKKNKAIIRFLLPVLWMALIFYASSRPRIGVPGSYWLSFIFFKSLHLIGYGILFSLWRLALYNIAYSLEISLLIPLLYGISDEIHQRYVPTREGRVRDVLIDFLGVLIFWLFFFNGIKKLVDKNTFLRNVFFS